MTKFHKILNCLLLLQTLLNVSDAQSSPGKVFLMGGALDDNTSSIYTALREATGKPNPKIAVAISAAGSLEVGLEAYYIDDPGSWSYERLFTFYQFQPSVILLAIDNYEEGSTNGTDLGRANIQIVRETDVIFFNGGDQSRHSRAWLNDDGSDSDIMQVLRQRFAEGAVIAGTSAGAAIQGSQTYGEGYSYGYYYFNGDLKQCQIGETLRDDRDGTNGFRYSENGGYMTGFGFVNDILVDTHLDARGRFGRLPAAMSSTQIPYGIGVGEDTTVYINQNIATVYGTDGVWIIDSTNATFFNLQHFAADNLKISYLTEGDTYNFINKKVISTKLPIISGSGDAYLSDDVFYQDEGIKCVKSLVTSGSSEAVGYSEESRPSARVIFYRGKGERAYKSGDLYTVDGMRMDIGNSRV